MEKDLLLKGKWKVATMGKKAFVVPIAVAGIVAVVFFALWVLGVFSPSTAEHGDGSADGRPASVLAPVDEPSSTDDFGEEAGSSKEDGRSSGEDADGDAVSASSSSAAEDSAVQNEAAVSFMETMGDGNTIVKASDTELDDAALKERIVTSLDEAVGLLAALPLYQDYNESVADVIERHFTNFSRGAVSIYTNVSDGKGHLDRDSVRVFEAGDLHKGNHKIAFSIVDANGIVLLTADGYYQEASDMFKITHYRLPG